MAKMQEKQESLGLLVFNIAMLLVMPYPFLDGLLVTFHDSNRH